MHGDDWFTLAEVTERLGGLVWVEERLAQVLQHWATHESSASAAVLFRTIGGHHAWHAEVVRGCLPTSPRLRPDEVVAAPTDGWQHTVATLDELRAPDATALRLRTLVKVVDPWLDREIGALVDLARPVSDGAMMRWLRFVALDHHDDGDAAALLTATQSQAVRVDDHRFVASLDLS